MTAGRTGEPMLRVVKGTKIYQGAQAISDVDFDIMRGEIHGLVGENGAGKSTLCKALAGAISLTSGDICVDGEKRCVRDPRRRARCRHRHGLPGDQPDPDDDGRAEHRCSAAKNI